jgi:hypothetical protein
MKGRVMNSINVLFLAYRRANFSLRNLKILNENPHISNIVVVIDGPRANSHNSELDQVFKKISSINYSKITEIVKFKDNTGLSAHLFRSWKVLGGGESLAMIVEEDKLLSSGLYPALKLSNDVHAEGEMVWAISTEFKHSVPYWGLNPIATLAERNGIAICNSYLISEAEEIFKSKKNLTNVLELKLSAYCDMLELGKVEAKRVIDYWRMYLMWGVEGPDRPDSLLLATLLLNGEFRFTLPEFIHTEIHHESYLGMNENFKIDLIPQHNPNIVKMNNKRFCVTCEINRLSKRSPYRTKDFLIMKVRALMAKLL